MAADAFGANEFTFTGDRTQITFFPTAPGPVVAGQEGALVEYQGIEGTFTFRGKRQVELIKSPLGTLVSVAFPHNPDTGRLSLTILVPSVTGVTRDQPATFDTLAIKASTLGNIKPPPGANLQYSILPLLGTAKDAILPL